MTETPMVVGGAFDGTLAPALDGQTIDGLQLESTYVWGLFRTHGDEPHIVQIMRRLATVEAWPPRLLLQSNFGVGGMRRHSIELMSARSRDVESSATELGTRLAAGAQDNAQSFDLSIDSESVRWAEGQLLEVSGAELTPGLQWSLVPCSDVVGAGGGDGGADGGIDGMRGVSRMFRVDGLFEGTEVDGFMGIDEVHLPPGRQNYVDDPLTASHLSDAWCTWATEYDDGSTEWGHVAFGRGGFGFALRAADGIVHVAERVTGEVVAADNGCPMLITVVIDGEAWEFVADARGLPIEPLPGPVRQAEGWFRRVGETRRPVVWCATPEIPNAS